MLARQYNRRAAAPRSVDQFAASGWLQHKPPTTLWEEFSGGWSQSWDWGLGGSLWDQVVSDPIDLNALYQKDPRMKERLSPERIAKEYPHTIAPIKTPRTRGEMELLAERDRREISLMQSLAGKNMSFLPDFLPNLAGAFGGAFFDPMSWITGVGVFTALPAVPLLRGLYTAANLSSSALKARGAAAGTVSYTHLTLPTILLV